MRKSTVRGIMACGLGLLMYGCGSSGIHMATYTEDRPRVDQEISGVDNQGYIGGTMRSSNIAERKKTRKIYVMEISKGTGNIEPIEEGQDLTGSATSADVDGAQAAASERFESYTVEKDDTLQKIAKKFYGSYSKWTRIYETNKSVIPNPDRIRPGTVLQVPLD